MMSNSKFRFDEKFSGALYIDSVIPLKEIISFIKTERVDKIILNYANGFNGDTISPFCDLPQIRSIEIVLQYADISCIQKMIQLEKLFITHYNPLRLDLSRFLNLKELSFEWSRYIKGLSSLEMLEGLGITKFRGSERELSNFSKLEELLMYEGNITTLDFLKNCKSLKKIDIAYLPKLRNVSSLLAVKDTLEILEIVSCKSIQWDGVLQQMKKLRKLILEGFEFENIDWLKYLPELQHLSLLGSNVLNGDISPAKYIDFVRIDNRRHYNYRFDSNKMKLLPK